MFRYRAWGMNVVLLNITIYDLGKAGNWTIAVKTIAFIWNNKRNHAVIFQNGVAIVKKTDEIWCVFNDV